MRSGQIIKEITVFILAALSLATLGVFLGVLMSGCAPQQRNTVVQAPPALVQPLSAPVPAPPHEGGQQIAWEPSPVVHGPKEATSAEPRPLKKPDFKDVITKSAATFAFNPDHEYVFSCPMWELLTIRLIPGETFLDYGSANLIEWMVQPLMSSVDGEPASVLLVKRGPQAPAATLVIVTDKNTYRMKLTPTGRGENRAVRFVRFRDPMAEVRREEQMIAAAERRKQKALEPRYPTINLATARSYQVRGNLPWTPVKVEGDHTHTFIYLPANTGAEVPTLTVMRDGEEARINTRTVPGNGLYGPVIIADGAFGEGKLIGQDGEVVIRGEN